MNITINTSKINLETPRLLLRGFCEDDLDDFYEYARVPGVGEAAGWPPACVVEETDSETMSRDINGAVLNMLYLKGMGRL